MMLQDAINQFLGFLKNVRTCSKHTIRNYRSSFAIFVAFCDTLMIKEAKEVNRDAVQGFVSYLTTKNDASTVHNRYAAVQSLFKYLHCEGKIKTNPAHNIGLPKKEVKLPAVCSNFNTVKPGESFEEKRDYAILLLMGNLGLRKSEVVNLDFRDYDQTNETIAVKGKGGKERRIPLCGKALEAVHTYISDRQTKVALASKAPMFFSRCGDRFKSIDVIVKKYLNTNAHSLRHLAATTLYKSSKNIKMVQDFLGHSNIQTTQIYVHVSTQDLRDALSKVV